METAKEGQGGQGGCGWMLNENRAMGGDRHFPSSSLGIGTHYSCQHLPGHSGEELSTLQHSPLHLLGH